MRIIQNRPAPRSPWHALLKRGTLNIISITVVLLFSVLSCPSSHAIGPYVTDKVTVIDQGTGLEWQKSDDDTLHTWQNALGYCEALSLDDKTDWRVPNIRELKSLVDYNRYYPAIDPSISCQSSSYWSGTIVENESRTSVWVVFFGNGDDIWKTMNESCHVRCVRDEHFSGQ